MIMKNNGNLNMMKKYVGPVPAFQFLSQNIPSHLVGSITALWFHAYVFQARGLFALLFLSANFSLIKMLCTAIKTGGNSGGHFACHILL